MSDQNIHIPHYSLTDIEQYLQGKMTAAEMYALEKASLQNPFLADAIEGYNAASMPEARQHLQEIQELLLPGKKEAKVVPLPTTNNKGWRIAAVAILLLGAGIITWLLLPNNNRKYEVAKAIITDSSNTIQQQHSATVPANARGASSPNLVETDTTSSWLANANASAQVEEKRFFKKQQIITHKDSLSLYAGNSVLKKESLVRKEESNRMNLADIESRSRQLNEVSAVTDSIQLASSSRNTNGYKDKMIAAVTPAYPMNISTNNLQGRITNQRGEAIANAYVNINHSNRNIVTDANGNFAFTSPDTSASITVNSLGYIPQQNLVNTNTSNHIVLKENSTALDEVTVVDYGVARKKSTTGMQPADNKMTIMKMDTLMPEGGWDKFKLYVANTIMGDNDLDDIENIEFHGDLEFEFRVDDKGNVKDVTILKSPDENKNDVIAEAVKQGPRWTTPEKKKKRKNKATIHF